MGIHARTHAIVASAAVRWLYSSPSFVVFLCPLFCLSADVGCLGNAVEYQHLLSYRARSPGLDIMDHLYRGPPPAPSLVAHSAAVQHGTDDEGDGRGEHVRERRECSLVCMASWRQRRQG